jgi:hypothetical protein
VAAPPGFRRLLAGKRQIPGSWDWSPREVARLPFHSAARSLLLWRQSGFSAPTTRATLQYMAVMQEAVEHRTDGGIAKQALCPSLLQGDLMVNNVLARS